MKLQSRYTFAIAIGILMSSALHAQESSAVDVVVEGDIPYRDGARHPTGRDLLDIYRPAQQESEALPVIVYFHGGALRQGDKIDGRGFASRVAPMGFVVASVNYRLTPEVAHPIHIQDAASATAWVKQNIANHGGNPSKLFVAGHSAGAYLAVLLGVDASHLAAHGVNASAIGGVIAVSPFLYVEETAKVRPKDVWGVDPEKWLAASVTPHIAGGKPPMLLIYADGDEDWRRDQNDRFGAALVAAKNSDVIVLQVPSRDHATIIRGVLDADDEVGNAVQRFVKNR